MPNSEKVVAMKRRRTDHIETKYSAPAKILKFWHKWSWVFHLGWAGCIMIVYLTSYRDATAKNTVDIALLMADNLPTRQAVTEANIKDIKDSLVDIKNTQGKIFDRINQIVDRGHDAR